MADKKQKKPQVHYLVTEPYLMTRGAALHFPYQQFKEPILTDKTVYGMVIDMPVNPQSLITLVAYINGAANLYFNNGNSYTGASQRYPGVVAITRTLISNAIRMLPDCEKAKTLDLPTGREHHLFLLTKSGIYRKVLSPMPEDIQQESQDTQAIYRIYNQLMRELHDAQLRDRTLSRSSNTKNNTKAK